MKMEQTLCYSRKMLVENGETLKWWFSRIMMLVFFSFGLVWFGLHKSSTKLRLQLINHMKSIKNWHNWKWCDTIEETPIYMQIIVQMKNVLISWWKKEEEKLRPHVKRKMHVFFFFSFLFRHYCEHNFAFKQLMNGRMSETMAKAIELWP